MTLLSMKEKTTSGKPISCEHCDSGDSAVSRCTECSVFLCNFCVTAHRRIIPFKGHQILSLAQVQKLGSKALVKPSFCVKHAGETLKLFCETCQETICRDCTIVDHREHKYNFVADIAKTERDVLQSSLNETKVKELSVAETLKAVLAMKQCVTSKMSEVNKDIDTFFDEQINALEYYRENFKHEVMDQGQERINKLENQEQGLSTFLAQLKSGMNFANQAMADGDDVKLLSLKQQLTQRLTQLNSAKIECKPCERDYMKLQVHRTVWDLKTEEMATLRYQPVDPQKCTVSMFGGEEGVMYQTLAGQMVDLVLINRDEIAIPAVDQVTAAVTFAKKGSEGYEESSCQVKLQNVFDHGDGSYSFSFRPKCEGHVSLSVAVEGQHVSGSPFSWNVYPVLPGEQSRTTEPVLPGEQSRTTERLIRKKELKRKKRRGSRNVKETNESVKRTDDVYAFTEGRHCWKLQLFSFNDRECALEIGVRVNRSFGFGGKLWYWSYDYGPIRSDREKPSIVSVLNNDVFTVFLNPETEKLIIYNNRSKQTDIFTGVQAVEVLPIISEDFTVPRIALE